VKLRTLALLAAAMLACGVAARAQPSRYVAFGDSITEGFGDDENRGGYPGRLEVLLNDAGHAATVENEGVDGETTAEGLSRVTKLSGASGDTFILMEGTNDVSGRVSNETIANNLEQIVTKAKQKGFGSALLATILPRGPNVNDASTRTATLALASNIRQSAFNLGIGQPEPFEIFYAIPNVFTTLYYDAFHPNGRGYDTLAGIFADYILGKDNVAPAPSFVDPFNGTTGVAPSALLQVTLFDPLSGVDTTQSTLLLDSSPIATDISGSGRRVVLSARPGNLSGKPILGVRSRDQANPANTVDEDVSEFTVQGTQFLVGDIDASGRVDGTDLVALGYSFGSKKGESRYKAKVDLNGDSKIDGSDLALLAANFGLSSF